MSGALTDEQQEELAELQRQGLKLLRKYILNLRRQAQLQGEPTADLVNAVDELDEALA